MRVVIDIESNSKTWYKTTEVWCIVAKDIDTGDVYVFRNLTTDTSEKERFHAFALQVTLWVGHNWLGYDYPVLARLCGFVVPGVASASCDTLILSRLLDYSRTAGHSVEAYGEEFGLEKIEFNDFTRCSDEMVQYCGRDVDITLSIFHKYHLAIHTSSLHLEQHFQLLVNDLEVNGFAFNSEKAEKLLEQVKGELDALDQEILRAFPPRLHPVKEVVPKRTKFGTLNRSDFRWVDNSDLSEYNGGPFTRCVWKEFNPSSHRQIIEVLAKAGWDPTEKTGTHIEVEREVNRLKYIHKRDEGVLQTLLEKLKGLQSTGWKINEINLGTLPASAPAPARTLAKRILLESRRRTLVEWLSCVQTDGRVHGRYYGIGAWTHRMAHQHPNTANIPSEFKEDGSVKLLGRELRSLWTTNKNRLLVGVDAEGIQLRIFAHYIDDGEFTYALVSGKKSKKTDPHSLNQRILGSVCKSRQAAKKFIYALLLGAGLGKLAQILGCSRPEVEDALLRLLERYTGFATLKKEVIPQDAQRGWFYGLDGRKVRIPGDTIGQRKHLAMSGYLQNGEAVIMKKAAIIWNEELRKREARYLFVNFVHDEWQTESISRSMDKAIEIASIQSDAIRRAGEDLRLRCPLAGSYYNDDHKDYTIGTNWYQTH